MYILNIPANCVEYISRLVCNLECSRSLDYEILAGNCPASNLMSIVQALLPTRHRRPLAQFRTGVARAYETGVQAVHRSGDRNAKGARKILRGPSCFHLKILSK